MGRLKNIKLVRQAGWERGSHVGKPRGIHFHDLQERRHSDPSVHNLPLGWRISDTKGLVDADTLISITFFYLRDVQQRAKRGQGSTIT